MAARSLDIIVNTQNGQLLSGFNSAVQAQTQPNFVFGDNTPISVRLVQPSGSADQPWSDIDLTDKSVRVGIGTPGGYPTAGTFTLTYGANTTSALSYDSTAAQVAAALNALASIVSAGGVTVSSTAAGSYRIVFSSVGVRTAISGNSTSLYPTSTAFIAEAQTGSASVQAVFVVRLEVQPAAYAELTDDFPVAAISVTTARAGDTGVSEIQKITFDPIPFGGVYTLAYNGEETTDLAWDAEAATIQAALRELTDTDLVGVTVTGTFPLFTVTFRSAAGNTDQLVASADALLVPTGKKGEISLNTTGVVELLAGQTRADVTLEIEIVDDITGDTWTPLQATAVLREDVIPNTPAAQSAGPVYLLESVANSRYLRYDQAQSLTSAQKTYGIDNIGLAEVKAANFTAFLGGVFIVTATSTVTDPGTPVEGKGFLVMVRNGTATVGGTAYATAGTIIRRIYHSGSYTNYVYKDLAQLPADLTAALGTNKATLIDGDKVAILDSAASDVPKHGLLSAFWTYIQSKFAAASSKATPIDADSFNLVDSADSNAAKRVTGTNLKAFLKTYFDTLYVALTGDQTVAGNKTFSGVMTATGQGLFANSTDTSVINRSLMNSRIGGNGVCAFVTNTQTGGTQTSVQFANANGSLGFGSAPLAGQAAAHVTYHPPNIIQSGSSYSSNTGGGGSIVDMRLNHALVIPIGLVNNATARDIEIRIALGSVTFSGTNNAKLGSLNSRTGYGIRVTKHAVNNTYEVRLVGRTCLGTGDITAATNASPIVVTNATHGLLNGDLVEITNVLGNTAANGVFTVQNVTTNTFELAGSTGNGAYVSGGAVQRLSASSVEMSPFTTQVFCLKWNASTTTISLSIGDIDQSEVLSLNRIALTNNCSMYQTTGLRIGFNSVTETTAFLAISYGQPTMLRI